MEYAEAKVRSNGGKLERLLGASKDDSKDYSEIDIYGTLIAEAKNIKCHIFMQKYHQLTVHEEGMVQCGVVHMGKYNKVNVSGEMKVSGIYTQKEMQY